MYKDAEVLSHPTNCTSRLAHTSSEVLWFNNSTMHPGSNVRVGVLNKLQSPGQPTVRVFSLLPIDLKHTVSSHGSNIHRYSYAAQHPQFHNIHQQNLQNTTKCVLPPQGTFLFNLRPQEATYHYKNKDKMFCNDNTFLLFYF